MKSLFLPVFLILAVACGKSSQQETAEVQGARAPETGVIDEVYEVVHEMDRKRVGFVKRTSYDSGRIIYWVYGPDYNERRGYVLSNNRAFKYVWHPGGRRAAEEELVADTRTSNVRRILEAKYAIVLEPIDAKKVAAEMLGTRYDKPKSDAGAKAKDGCGDGCGCGCGDGE